MTVVDLPLTPTAVPPTAMTAWPPLRPAPEPSEAGPRGSECDADGPSRAVAPQCWPRVFPGL